MRRFFSFLNAFQDSDTDTFTALSEKWPWFLTIGVGLIALGAVAIANRIDTMLASVVFAGWLMITGGIFHVIHFFRVKTLNPGWMHLCLGLLYGVAGVLAVLRPFAGALSLTFVFSIFLMALGLSRIVFSFWKKSSGGGGWEFASGLLSLFLGVVIMMQWPWSSAWTLGLSVGVILLVDGLALSTMALVLRGSRPGNHSQLHA